MKTLILMPLFLFTVGCATFQTPLHKTVLEQIHEGDSKDKLVEVLGLPDQFGPSQTIPGGTAYYYSKGRDTCGFALENDVVKRLGCQSDPQYLSPAATFFKAFGKSMQEQQRRTVTCDTSGTADTMAGSTTMNTTTNCR